MIRVRPALRPKLAEGLPVHSFRRKCSRFLLTCGQARVPQCYGLAWGDDMLRIASLLLITVWVVAAHAESVDQKLIQRRAFFSQLLSAENSLREERWDIRTHGGVWVGTVEIQIMKNNDVFGYIQFPPNACGERNTITGAISGDIINLSRHCDGLGGILQNYSGIYVNNKAAAEGLISGPGAGSWNAVIHRLSP